MYNKNSLLGYIPVTIEKREIGISSREICEMYRAVVMYQGLINVEEQKLFLSVPKKYKIR
jgi:hypothetical protein